MKFILEYYFIKEDVNSMVVFRYIIGECKSTLWKLSLGYNLEYVKNTNSDSSIYYYGMQSKFGTGNYYYVC